MKIDLLKFILVIRVMPGSFGGDTYKRTKLWVYFRPSHELAGADLGHQEERNGTLPCILSSRMLPFGNCIVGSPWPMYGEARALSEMSQMVFLVKLADVFAIRINFLNFTCKYRLMEISLLGF